MSRSQFVVSGRKVNKTLKEARELDPSVFNGENAVVYFHTYPVCFHKPQLVVLLPTLVHLGPVGKLSIKLWCRLKNWAEAASKGGSGSVHLWCENRPSM